MEGPLKWERLLSVERSSGAPPPAALEVVLAADSPGGSTESNLNPGRAGAWDQQAQLFPLNGGQGLK